MPMLARLLDLYSLVVLIAVILSCVPLDRRNPLVTITQALSTYTALQRLGVESKLLVFPDEGHWILKPKNSKVFHDVVLAWIGEHLSRAPSAANRLEDP